VDIPDNKAYAYVPRAVVGYRNSGLLCSICPVPRVNPEADSATSLRNQARRSDDPV